LGRRVRGCGWVFVCVCVCVCVCVDVCVRARAGVIVGKMHPMPRKRYTVLVSLGHREGEGRPQAGGRASRACAVMRVAKNLWSNRSQTAAVITGRQAAGAIARRGARIICRRPAC
jgi:hypothetical protein